MDGRTEQPGERGRTPAPLAAEPGSAVWLQVMQFHQRTAATMQEAQAQTRRDFLAARKWPLCTWQVFAHHALMEWRQNRALHPEKLDLAVKIVKNIFELGLRKPSVQAQPRYIETFAEWLVRAPPCELCGACAPPSTPPPSHFLSPTFQPSPPFAPARPLHRAASPCCIRSTCSTLRAESTGAIDNARLLFQNAVADESAARDPAMRAAFVRFEAQYGSVAETTAAEAAWRSALAAAASADALPAAAPATVVQQLYQRYCFLDLWPCTLRQRRHLEAIAGGPGATRCALLSVIAALSATAPHRRDALAGERLRAAQAACSRARADERRASHQQAAAGARGRLSRA